MRLRLLLAVWPVVSKHTDPTSRQRLISEGTVTPVPQPEIENAGTFNPALIKEFTPQQNYDMSSNVSLSSFAPCPSR